MHVVVIKLPRSTRTAGKQCAPQSTYGMPPSGQHYDDFTPSSLRKLIRVEVWGRVKASGSHFSANFGMPLHPNLKRLNPIAFLAEIQTYMPITSP
jgi:hypothetical protein